MNLLAHAYLSYNHPPILVGNMISDYVKGNNRLRYDALIQKGITLHRAIDDFTDHHTATQAAKLFFKESYRLYAGAFVDVVYDHFLANDDAQFADAAALYSFAQTTYGLLKPYQAIMPEKFGQMLPYMQAQNWLYHYRFKEGIEKSFQGLVRRSAYLTDAAPGYQVFLQHYNQLQQCYQLFFPALKAFTHHWYQQYMPGEFAGDAF
ncbi:MAG: hypothetical protein RL172_1325 [Bacteroidota bacterium]|jgi:acyl carrier protein phosphodiesterase